MKEATGAPSSLAACSPRRPRASSRDGGGVINRPPSPLTMLLSRHTRRRDLVAGLGAVAAWPLPISAQMQRKVPRIGYLGAGIRTVIPSPVKAFLEGLRDLGYLEGQNFVLVERYAEGHQERLPELVLELIQLEVDVIVAPTSGSAK